MSRRARRRAWDRIRPAPVPGFLLAAGAVTGFVAVADRVLGGGTARRVLGVFAREMPELGEAEPELEEDPSGAGAG